MPKDEGILPCLYRSLIKDISMIAVKRLPFRCSFDVIKCSGICDNSSTDGEASLILYYNGLFLGITIQETDQADRYEYPIELEKWLFHGNKGLGNEAPGCIQITVLLTNFTDPVLKATGTF